MADPQKCALYLRVSTTCQDVHMQDMALKEFCQRRGWSVVAEYKDVGVSGSKDKRPALTLLMADAKKRKFDAVLVYKWDRFARSTAFLANSLREFESLGIDFISVTEGTDTTTPQGRLLFGIMGCIAEFERNLIRERIMSGMAAAKERLKIGPYRRPDGKLVRHLGRAKVQVDIAKVQELRGQGWSWERIAQELGVHVETVKARLAEATSASL